MSSPTPAPASPSPNLEVLGITFDYLPVEQRQTMIDLGVKMKLRCTNDKQRMEEIHKVFLERYNRIPDKLLRDLLWLLDSGRYQVNLIKWLKLARNHDMIFAFDVDGPFKEMLMAIRTDSIRVEALAALDSCINSFKGATLSAEENMADIICLQKSFKGMLDMSQKILCIAARKANIFTGVNLMQALDQRLDGDRPADGRITPNEKRIIMENITSSMRTRYFKTKAVSAVAPPPSWTPWTIPRRPEPGSAPAPAPASASSSSSSMPPTPPPTIDLTVATAVESLPKMDAATAAMLSDDIRVDAALCIICVTEPVQVVFMPCEHMIYCRSCYDKSKPPSCPYCRRKIDRLVKPRIVS